MQGEMPGIASAVEGEGTTDWDVKKICVMRPQMMEW